LLFLVGATSLYQGWFLGLGGGTTWVKHSDGSLDQEYTRALASGQSYLLTPPDPRVLADPDPFHSPHFLLDASLHNGRYYIYFGIVPFATLLLPWFVATGTLLSAPAAVLFFSILGYLAHGGMLLMLAGRFVRGRPAAAIGIVFIGIVVSGGTWPLMARPAIYEVENAAAFAYFGWALFALAHAEFLGAARFKYMCAAALAALTLGCRPNYFPAVLVAALYILWRALQAPGGRATRALGVVSSLLPLFLVGLALAWWNFHRFGNPMEFGAAQVVQSSRGPATLSASICNVPYNAHRYLLGCARLGSYFPFIAGQIEGPFTPAKSQELSDQVYGFLFVSPFVLLGCLLAFAGHALREQGASKLAGLLALTGLGNLLYLSLIGFSSYRYAVDFLGPLALLAGMGALQIDPLGPGLRRRLLFPFLCLVVAWGACWSLFETCSIAQVHALFDRNRPGDFRRLARPFNAVAYRIEQIRGDGPRALRLDLRFPKGKSGRVEPLVVSGTPSAQDFLYAYYAGPDTIQFGFESMGRGGPVTGPIGMDYGASHLVDVFFGSFLPPDDHPLLSGLSEAELGLARRMVRIRLDGRVAMESAVRLHPVNARISIGESPDNPAFGRTFTGAIVSVERPLLKDTYFHPGWTTDMFGPLSLSVRLVRPAGRPGEPILSIGYRPAGGMLALEPLESGQMRLVWMRFGESPIRSAPFSLAYDVDHRVEFSAGSLFPPSDSPLWKGADAPSIARRKSAMTCRIDGRVVLDLKVETPDTSPNEIFPGRNTLGTAGISDSLQGAVESAAREAW